MNTVLPPTAPITLLESKHETWSYHFKTWQTISELREGAIAILKNPQKYLPKRPGEDRELYQVRLSKLSYTPIFSTAVREFTAKLTSSPVHVSGIKSDEDFWKNFFDRLDGKSCDQSEFLGKVFSSLLYFGRVYVGVDKPRLGVKPRNKAEEPSVTPYALVYEPLMVPNWGSDWYMTRQTTTEQLPLQEAKQYCLWTFWTPDQITTYRAEVQLGSDGWTVIKVKVGDSWLPASDPKVTVPMYSQTSFKTGGRPTMVAMTLPGELWTGGACYLKQIQHLVIESSWTDAGSIAGTVQRVFTPQIVPQDDPRYLYEAPTPENLKADNAHVLIGADYKFVESSGHAIANLTGQLQEIERSINRLVSMGWKSIQEKTVEQSGLSKQVDQDMLQTSMKAYGRKVAQLYQDVLQLVASLGGRLEVPTVSGLDSYSTETLGDMLEASEKLELVVDRIPQAAIKQWYAKLSNLLSGSVSPEVEAAIKKELESLYNQQIEPLETVEPQQSVKKTRKARGSVNSPSYSEKTPSPGQQIPKPAPVLTND